MVCHDAGGRVRVVGLCRRIHHRHGLSDQFSGVRDIGLAAGAGEEAVVADAMEPLWQDVEQEAPDELVGREGHRAKPRLPVAAVVLVAKGDAALPRERVRSGVVRGPEGRSLAGSADDPKQDRGLLRGHQQFDLGKSNSRVLSC